MTSIAQIFRRHFDDFAHKNEALTLEHYKVAHAIMECGTETMGGHVWRCPECRYELTMYNSCRNRHCPRCQAYASAQWVQARIDELLPVQYFHVVFTIPAQLNPFALRNKTAFYSIMFRAVSQTIKELGENPRFIGGTVGFTAVLHTWGSNLMDHPHIHCIIPGGALTSDQSQWISSRKKYLYPVPVMRRLFRGKLMAYFKYGINDKSIGLHGNLRQYNDPILLQELYDTLYCKEWVVYAKRPFANPRAVIKYLGSYTHRIAISNRRIVDVDESAGKVTFKFKDYRRSGKRLEMTLSCEEFIRRFMLHVVPPGFMRIRHFGFLSNRLQKILLPVCRKLLGSVEKGDVSKETRAVHWYDIIEKLTGRDPLVCGACGKGRLELIGEFPRKKRLVFLQGGISQG